MATNKADVKIVMIGAASVGKTSLVSRYIEGTFSTQEKATIGASFFLKRWGQKNAAIWDTAGEERWAGLSSFYCRDAGAALMVYDITKYDTFEILKSHYLPLVPETALKLIVGSHYDLIVDGLKPREVTVDEAMELAMEINRGFTSADPKHPVPFFETSSKTAQNVDSAFNYVFANCLGTNSELYALPRIRGSIKIRTSPKQGSSKNCC